MHQKCNLCAKKKTGDKYKSKNILVFTCFSAGDLKKQK